MHLLFILLSPVRLKKKNQSDHPKSNILIKLAGKVRSQQPQLSVHSHLAGGGDGIWCSGQLCSAFWAADFRNSVHSSVWCGKTGWKPNQSGAFRETPQRDGMWEWLLTAKICLMLFYWSLWNELHVFIMKTLHCMTGHKFSLRTDWLKILDFTDKLNFCSYICMS